MRGAQTRGHTFKHCAEQLIASHEVGWRNAKHRQQWKNTLATYVYPTLGHLPVSDVDTGLVLVVLRQPIQTAEGEKPLWNARSETASRMRGRIESVLNWAKAHGYRDGAGANPAAWRGHLDHLLPAPSKVRRVRHHAALPYTEIPAFMRICAREWDNSARPRVRHFDGRENRRGAWVRAGTKSTSIVACGSFPLTA